MDNYRDLAEEFLSEYQKIMKKINKLNDEYLLLESKSTSIKSSVDLNTGTDKKGNQVLLVSKQRDPLSKEKKLVKNIDDKDRIINEVLELRIRLIKIEETIRDLVPPSNERAALICRAQGCTYAETGKVVNRSDRGAKLVYIRGLQQLGEALYNQAKELNII